VNPPLQPLQGALREAFEALAADPAEAERRSRAILEAHPGQPSAITLLAIARRRVGFASEAVALLGPLADAHPNDSTLRYELGLTLASLGRTQDAVAHLRRAVAVRPDMGRAWRTLGDLLFQAGERAGADDAYGRYYGSPPADLALAEAARAIARGEPEAAEPLLARHLEAWPGDVVALGLLADTCRQRSAFGRAAALLEGLLERHPSCVAARFTLADALYKQGDHGRVLVDHLRRVIAAQPRNYQAHGLLGMTLLALNDATGAVEAFRTALAETPSDPRFWVALGEALKFAGWPQEAEAAYRQAIAVDPRHGEAWFRLGDLKTYAFSPKEVAAMRAALEAADLDAEPRALIHYALARACHDAGDPGDAFAHYAAGAALQRTRAPPNPAADAALLARSKAMFTPAFFAARAEGGSPDPAVIFIVGLPRSGSTLVEQILASHPDVEGTHELFLVPRLVQRLTAASGAPYPGLLEALSPGERRTLGEGVIAAAEVHRRLGRPRFIDKQPANFQHVGLIHLILPNARVIDIRRHPMASGFAMFRQHFGVGREFSYDLADLGRYYRYYLETMRMYDEALPGTVCRVTYEDLIDDPEREIRRLLDYCRLPFDEACLRFHENRRAIMTPSAEQVRRPIFREALEEWRAYAPWLGPLEEALGPALTTWRD
jgi:Flp pilus assembly protein TadD